MRSFRVNRLAAIAICLTVAATAPVSRLLAEGDAEPKAEMTPTALEVGQKVPEFKLTDTLGQTHSLADYEGKTVVLEWFNPDCPFVKKHHELHHSMNETYAAAKGMGVVWLAINSGAPGKQGAGDARNKEATKEYALTHPVLIDDNGAVGKHYGARNTPGMYVIDEAQVLRYAGAIDNAPRGTPADGETYRNHVVEALSDIAAKRAVRVAETKQYGCSVKYAD
jgi:peroxiredoxin